MMQSARIPIFQRTMLPPYSGWSGSSMVFWNVGILTTSLHRITTQKTTACHQLLKAFVEYHDNI